MTSAWLTRPAVALLAVAGGLAMTPVTDAEAVWLAGTVAGSDAGFGAATMLPGHRPMAAAVPANGTTVHLSWLPSTGGATVAGYRIVSHDASGDPREPTGTCSGLVAATTCSETGVPDGVWTYTVTPRQQSWSGATSPASEPVVVDSVQPTAAVTFPVDGATYGDERWEAGCAGAICGTAEDAAGGSTSVKVSIRRASGAPTSYWDGTSFASTSEVLLPTDGAAAWSLPFPAAGFPDDGAYTVRVVATDRVGNAGSGTATFTVDRTPPETTLDHPAADEGSPALGLFTGPATWYSDATWNAGCPTPGFCGGATDPAGVASVEVSIRRDATGQYWDGSGFSGAGEVLLPATGEASWSLPHPADRFPAEGRYTAWVVATDGVGNVARTTSTFSLDRTAPSGEITFPGANEVHSAATWDAGCPDGPGVCGTASDADSGVGAVAVSIGRGSGSYWDGSDFGSESEVLLPATGTTSWSFPFPQTAFPEDGDYVIRVVTTDTAGSESTVSATVDVHREVPGVQFTHPAPGGVYADATWGPGCPARGICGTATDDHGDLTSVEVSVREAGGGYWDGSDFDSEIEVLQPATGVTDWSFPLPAAELSDGSYQVRVVASDAVGNDTSVTVDFTFDRTAPTVALTFPAAGATYSGSGWNEGCDSSICGTADDASGVASVAVSLRRDDTGEYWNGGGFASAAEVLVAATGTTSWSLPFPPERLPEDGDYTVRAVATDRGGNTGTTATATFDVRRRAPTVGLVHPSPETVYSQASWNEGCGSAICGTADDPAGGLASVAVSVRREETGDYWNGGGFTSAAEVLVTAAGTESWSLGFPGASFPADGDYTLRVVVSDDAGNVDDLSATFAIDRTAAPPEITFPRSLAYGADAYEEGCTPVGFCGVADDPHGLSSVALSVRQVASGSYWDGTSFAAGGEVLVPATGTESWSLGFPVGRFLDDGDYTVRVVATDTVGNTGSASVTLTLDQGVPELTLDHPRSGDSYTDSTWNAVCTSRMCGTAGDVTGIASVRVSVRQGSGSYWNGTSFASAGEVLMAASGTESWSLPFPAANFPAGGTYTVGVAVTDLVGNIHRMASTFTVDRNAPTVAVGFPAAGTTYASASWDGGCGSRICGTAADAVAGVASVAVSVRRDGTGSHWDGTSFAAGSEVLVPAAGTTSWSLPFPATNFPAAGSYTVRAVATDRAGNIAAVAPTVMVDVAAPTAAVTFPATGETYRTASWDAGGCPGGTSRICGTAADTGSGVASVAVSLRQGSGNYWNGAGFGSAAEVLVPVTGTTSWNMPFPGGSFAGDGPYTVRVVVTDGVGNVGGTSATVTIDRTAPRPVAAALQNGNGLARPGDSLQITYSEPLRLSTLCSAWTGTGDQSVTGATVTITNNSQNDRIAPVSSPTCTIDLGTTASGRNYVFTTATFTGSTVSWQAAANRVVVTLGTLSSGSLNTAAQAASTVQHTPKSTLTDRAGNVMTTTTVSTTGQRF